LLRYTWRGKAILNQTRGTFRSAATFLSMGVLLYALTRRFGISVFSDGSLALAILGFLFRVWSGFSWVFGRSAFRAGLFPLLFLLLLIPLLDSGTDRFLLWLEWGSAGVTSRIFQATGTPLVRNGLFFTLPSVTIEIAKECSGIRSATALLITCPAAGYLLLRLPWTRAVFLFATVPVLNSKERNSNHHAHSARHSCRSWFPGRASVSPRWSGIFRRRALDVAFRSLVASKR
jgi:exosortase